MFNVNVPPVQVYELKQPLMCGLSRNIYRDTYERRVSPRGQVYFWLKPETPDPHPTPGSDVDLLGRGHITCTFLGPEPLEQGRYQDLLDEL